jgi:hypothetical protein
LFRLVKSRWRWSSTGFRTSDDDPDRSTQRTKQGFGPRRRSPPAPQQLQ